MVHYVFQVVTNLRTCCFIPPSDCQVQWKYWSYGSGIRDHNWTLGTLEVQRNLACLIFVHQRTGGNMWPDIKSGTPRVSQRFFFGTPPKKKNHVPKNFKWWRFWSEKKTRTTFFGVAKISPQNFGAGTRPWINKDQPQDQVSEGSYKLHPQNFTANKNRKIGNPKRKIGKSSFCIQFSGAMWKILGL